MAQKRRKIGEILKQWGRLTDKQLEEALKIAAGQRKRLGEVLVELSFVTETDVAKALASQFDMEYIDLDLPEALKGFPLYLGGPVQPSALSFLHSDALLADANVMPNLSLGHSMDSLIELGESLSPTRKIKMFAGYAGWSAGQLESEMKHKAWLTHPASLELVFDSPPEQLWQEILRRKGGQYRILAQSPDDLSLN